jgi:Ty3 transposon capsid-like protein
MPAGGGSTTAPTTTMKKELRTPTPFSGKRDDLRKFLQEVKIYLLANEHIYTTDQDRILFVLSFMSEGDANSWKEEFFETAEQTTPFTLGKYNDLIKLITKDFSPYDAPKDAIYQMKEMKMGNTPIEEHVAKFKMLVTKSKLDKNEAVVEYFRETLPIPLQRNILSLPDPPNDLNKWYEWAIKLQNNHLRMQSAIMKMTNKGNSSTNTNTNRNRNNNPGPRRFYFQHRQEEKDPNAMDVDAMNTERDELMKKRLCFLCKKPGHISRFCPGKNQRQSPPPPKKMNPRDLHTHIKALMTQMDEKDVEEFFKVTGELGF